jgi:SAM-dependent methyltransferase
VDDDVASPIDLRDPHDAQTWADEAERKRPWRGELRRCIAELARDARHILELGAGPGLLAETILVTGRVERYTILDFSPPFLAMCRARLAAHATVELVLGDFTSPTWPALIAPPFDAVVAMQAVHEVRHKRHLPRLYTQIAGVLRPGGMLVVCDHEPFDDSPRAHALLATEAEQHAALHAAGFAPIATQARVRGMYICSGSAQIRSST